MRAHVAARAVMVVLGCIAIAWGAAAFPVFKRSANIENVAARIIRRYPFRPQQLQDEVSTLQAIENEPHCEARPLRSDAIIRLRIAEIAFSEADIARLDTDMTGLREAIRKSLSCSPTDAFLWLSLFWVNANTEGFRPSDIELLRMSYKEGPNEGWLMTTRNHLALAIFPHLPSDLADRALAEFAELLQPGFVDVAVDNFVGPGWPIRNVLLDRIKDAPKSQRRAFAQILDARGYDIDVPGIIREKSLGH